ncbi:hypothetical protein HanXRQr2_Chr03g0091851 [Helianthus annuus]|uniref:Uncharacterized protein n=1 Tax=Helianthus annuus TaxID=4232 RepID=A0A9K3NUZ6_HELAN|nr:hypothetical protein HanXRQr2_Chr03g0091851 [Helianthus annuus]
MLFTVEITKGVDLIYRKLQLYPYSKTLQFYHSSIHLAYSTCSSEQGGDRHQNAEPPPILPISMTVVEVGFAAEATTIGGARDQCGCR